MLILKIFLVIILLVFNIYFGRSFFFGAPFAVTTPSKVKKMIKLAEIKSGEKVVDLGSGDGRIVMALARAGALAYGYEINPFLAGLARRKIKKAGLQARAEIRQKSYWRDNMGNFDKVVLFGVPYMMSRLEKKLKHELKPGAIVVSNKFKFSDWQPLKQEDNIFIYKKDG